MERKTPTGIENAIFDEIGWCFRDRHSFWEGCAERPECFAELKERYGEDAEPDLGPVFEVSLNMATLTLQLQGTPEARAELESIKEAFAAAKTDEERVKLMDRISTLMDESLDAELDAELGAGDDEELDDQDEDDDFDDEDDEGEWRDGEPRADGIAGVMLLDETGKGCAPEQRAAYEAFLKHEREIGQRVLEALFQHYQKIRPDILQWHADAVPAVKKADELRNLIAYGGMTVHRPDEDGVCDLGFSFHCWWDPEHGVGARVRNGQVIAVGPQCAWQEDDWECEQV